MLELKTYTDPQAFWKATSADLKKQEAAHNLILGQSYQFLTKSELCQYMAAVSDGSEIVCAAILSQNRTHINFVSSQTQNSIAVSMLINDFFKNSIQPNIQPNSLITEKSTAQIYSTELEKLGFKLNLKMEQGIYRCRKVQLPPHSERLHFRLALETDAPLIANWLEAFHHEAVPHDPPLIALEVAVSKIQNKMMYLLEDNGTPVSMVGWSRDIKSSCSVNAVYTPPIFRKKGYASLSTALITQKLLAEGRQETNLYTDMTNPTSNKIYQNIGYEFVCHSVHWALSTPQI